MDDLGELVVAWLNGDLPKTPDHPEPDPETIPLVPALTVINRGGFITTNSQLAETSGGRTWNTWVAGIAADATLTRLRNAVEGTPLTLMACRLRVHECGRGRLFRSCPNQQAIGDWSHASPRVKELGDAWSVIAEDPEPGRNDLLWPVLVNALEGR